MNNNRGKKLNEYENLLFIRIEKRRHTVDISIPIEAFVNFLWN